MRTPGINNHRDIDDNQTSRGNYTYSKLLISKPGVSNVTSGVNNYRDRDDKQTGRGNQFNIADSQVRSVYYETRGEY